MNISLILKSITRLILPYMIMFGIYLILHGDLSPGGGFQGGVMLATAYLTTYFLYPDRISSLNKWLKIEKLLIVLFVLTGLLALGTHGVAFTNPIKNIENYQLMRVFLIILNGLIGFEVALGMMVILSAFIEEGR